MNTESVLLFLPHDDVVTNSTLQQCPAVQELTAHLQTRKPRHPKRPKLSQVKPSLQLKKIVHSVSNIQIPDNYNKAFKQ